MMSIITYKASKDILIETRKFNAKIPKISFRNLFKKYPFFRCHSLYYISMEIWTFYNDHEMLTTTWNQSEHFETRNPVALGIYKSQIPGFYTWETHTKLCVFPCVVHANRQSSEIACLTKTSH